MVLIRQRPTGRSRLRWAGTNEREMTVSDTPWSQFSQADYTAQQWARACLIDTEQGAPDQKDRYKLPVREPSGVVNRNAVHAASARLDQVEGVASDKKAVAARSLVSLYHDLGEDPPDSLMGTAGNGQRSAQGVERIFTNMFVKEGSPIQVRSASNGAPSRVIGGYASVFNRYSENLGGFVERVAPSFFNKSRADGWPGVVCRYNHQDNFLLGATRSGTLQLSIDETGLNYNVDLPECRSDVLEMVGRGDISNSSFAFQVFDQEWGTSEQGYPVRTLISGRLIDVAPVSVPAYPDASVGLRSLAEHTGAPLEDVVKLAECDELRKLFVRTDGDGKPKPKAKPKQGRQALMEILARRPEDPIGKV